MSRNYAGGRARCCQRYICCIYVLPGLPGPGASALTCDTERRGAFWCGEVREVVRIRGDPLRIDKPVHTGVEDVFDLVEVPGSVGHSRLYPREARGRSLRGAVS